MINYIKKILNKKSIEMKDVTTTDILSTFKRLGYKLEESKGYPNLFGIRSKNQGTDQFDDKIGAIVFVDNSPKLFMYDGTTDPGLYYLKNPMRKEGTAILIPGQYINCFKVGTHKGYRAYEQIGNMTYIRDNNKDKYLDMVSKGSNGMFKGNIKSNLHRASQYKKSKLVDKWSAACQVVADPKEYSVLLGLGVDASSIYGLENKFNYTLFREEDFISTTKDAN